MAYSLAPHQLQYLHKIDFIPAYTYYPISNNLSLFMQMIAFLGLIITIHFLFNQVPDGVIEWALTFLVLLQGILVVIINILGEAGVDFISSMRLFSLVGVDILWIITILIVTFLLGTATSLVLAKIGSYYGQLINFSPLTISLFIFGLIVGVILVGGMHVVSPPHYHGTMIIEVDGENTDLSSDQYQMRSGFFHFEAGQGEIWHVHSKGITVQYALESLGFEITNEKISIPSHPTDCELSSVSKSGREIDLGYVFRQADSIQITIVCNRPQTAVSCSNCFNEFSEGAQITP